MANSIAEVLAEASQILRNAGVPEAIRQLTLTFHYKTLKVTSRPKLTVETYRLTASKGTWTPQASRYQYDWVRDGKIFLRTELRDYYPQKADVGHRIKVCVTASRSGYASGRSCSDYSRTIKTY